MCFDQKHIVVRNGKGDKDRITFLPDQAVAGLKHQIEAAKRLHRLDVDEGFEQVYMPNALARKYPSACKEAAWKWVFPAERRCIDKRSGQMWRHHIGEEQFRNALKKSQRQAGIDKNGVAHSLRHSFATHLVEAGTDVQTIQKLMGHKDVETTMRYIHVQPKLGVHVRSPVDTLGG